MPNFDISALTSEQQPIGCWTAALLHALARDEAAGRRPQRLTEPQLATWTRFRGRLSSADLVALLFEDAAVLYPVPFDAASFGSAALQIPLPDSVADAWVGTLSHIDLSAASAGYVTDQARLLALPTRMARSDLHIVKPHQKVLELPGTGGQLAHHLTLNQTDLTLQDNFVIACGSWQEMTLAGIVALDRGAPHASFVVKADAGELRDAGHPLRQRSFDYVIGLHADKGGLFRVQDQLAIWFPTAKILLV